ncbi:MAG: HypC/HybG/HupF family hydrogenase formation chaperone [Gemmataceae bacterium]
MCLALPGRLIRRFDQDGVPMGVLEFGGVRKDACLACLPDLVEGEYAVVHAGFAIGRVDEAAALAALRDFQAMEDAEP